MCYTSDGPAGLTNLEMVGKQLRKDIITYCIILTQKGLVYLSVSPMEVMHVIWVITYVRGQGNLVWTGYQKCHFYRFRPSDYQNLSGRTITKCMFSERC